MKTMLMRSALGAALVLSGFVQAARAQAGASPDPTTVPQLKAEFDRGAKLGVPMAPLLATARLGMMHSAPTNKIRDAVHGTADRYVTAREALNPVQTPAELDAGAVALQVNISKTILSKMRKDYPTRALTVPLGALQILVTKGVPAKQAVATVDKMLRQNESDTRIASLGTDIQGLLATGLAPSAAFDALSRSVLSLPQSPASGAALSPQRK
jgi:hypothetical protein